MGAFSPPAEREIFPLFTLPDYQGQPYHLGVLRQRYNLVLTFVRDLRSDVADFLHGLAAVSDELAELEAKVIVVVAGPPARGALLRRELGTSFQVLCDEEGSLVNACCGTVVAVYVTDRYLEVFFSRT